MKKVAIYARVSTDSQTVENQLQELHAVAQRNGWIVTAVFNDEGISGAKGAKNAPASTRSSPA
jgi:DNA invertase Pin-like site-specific DNA recombinase